MSKRSSRRKRKAQARKKTARLTGPVLTQQGKIALKKADFNAAIDAWEKARHKPNISANLPAALAEAYFRRAFTASAPTLADLQQAVKLAPTDPRYIYHVALAHHRLDQIEQAEPLYRQLLTLTPPFQRAAFPLAQLLVVKGQDIATDTVWSYLNEEEQNCLSAILALYQNQPVAALRYISPGQADFLWSGLAAFALGETVTARQDFKAGLDTLEISPLSRSVVYYYLGLLAAQADQHEAALTHWQTAQANGFDTPHLRQNLAILLYRQALAQQQAGRSAQALKLLEKSQKLDGSVTSNLTKLRGQLHLEAGYAAFQQGHWAEALQHWQAAEKIGDKSRRLITNMAVTYDKLAQFQQAAELWRQVLRNRPRSTKHPEALNDAQVARLWQHIAESYGKARDYEEAITTYRNALKWSPDNIDLQLDLVDMLQAEGRWQAAENELKRILKKHPNHIATLTRQAESYESDGDLDEARDIWQRILEIDPQNSVARPQLAHLYEEEVLEHLMEGMPWEALDVCEEGLEEFPDKARLHTLTGAIYAELDNFDQTRHYFKQALKIDTDQLSTLRLILAVWVQYRQFNEIDKILKVIKALDPPAPSDFLLDLVDICSDADLITRTWKLLEFVEQLYPNDPQVLMDIAWRLYDDDQDSKAIGYLRRILHQDSNHTKANMILGTIYYLKDQRRLARRHWSAAEKQARKENDEQLLFELKITKDALMRGISPPPRGLGSLMHNMPPELADFLDEFDNFKKS